MVVGELVERCRSSSALSRTGGQLVVQSRRSASCFPRRRQDAKATSNHPRAR
jgi:hypothetical protein